MAMIALGIRPAGKGLRRSSMISDMHTQLRRNYQRYYSVLRPDSEGSGNDFTHVIIGGGVVGLAIAARLVQRPGTSTVILEKNGLCGTETSSRNSEVIHAGIYYPSRSLKTKLCVRGAKLLYQFCEESNKNVGYKRIGKWIVAQTPAQLEELKKMQKHAETLGVPTTLLTPEEASAIEPHIRATHGVLESPNTGIINSHEYMQQLQLLLSESDAGTCDIAVGSLVTGISHNPNPKTKPNGYRVWVGDAPNREMVFITADTVINAAGLGSVDVANMLYPDPEDPRRLKKWFAKGNYFSYAPKDPEKKMVVKRLVYPVVEKGLGGLGTHLTLDMAGRMRFGPDVEWTDDPEDLKPSEGRVEEAVKSISEYLPGITREDIVPDYCGMRIKLKPKGATFQDFVIEEESKNGFPGFINLLGIESPGLTSSLAIAEQVEGLLYEGCDPVPNSFKVKTARVVDEELEEEREDAGEARERKKNSK
ncbi:NAD dehydrogenase [Peziza echinospora]|nr:NAD dehydrogenase [Peziza echinospora]